MNRTRCRVSSGFTLIEILVVLTIIGITVGVALLAFGDFGASRSVEMEAEQLQSIIKLTQQQAILESGTLGVDITKTGYQVFRFVPPATWDLITKPSIFKGRNFPKNTRVHLSIPFKAPNKVPDIVINATGDLTPFTLELGTHAIPTVIRLTGEQNGNLSLQRMNQ